MKYLNIFTACAGLATAVPTLNPRQTENDETDKICKTREWDASECKVYKNDCERTGKGGPDQLINCLKITGKTCKNDNECGRGFKCAGPLLLPGTHLSCEPKTEQPQAEKRDSASPTKEQTQDTSGTIVAAGPGGTKQPIIDLNGKNPFFEAESQDTSTTIVVAGPEGTKQPIIDLNGKNPFFEVESQDTSGTIVATSPKGTKQPIIDLNGKNPFFEAEST